MQLTIFNGSPRGMGGNSRLIIEWLIQGVKQNSDVNIETLSLIKINEHDSYISKLKASEIALVVIPLYTDSMPGIVMAYIEKLQPLRKSLKGLKLGFIVHSGFPEACHSRYIEKYLGWLSGELGADYMGTVVFGGSEGLNSMSPKAIAKKQVLFNEVGRKITVDNQFDPVILKKIAGWERLSKVGILIVRILVRMGIINSGWNNQLKSNNALGERDAKPYK